MNRTIGGKNCYVRVETPTLELFTFIVSRLFLGEEEEKPSSLSLIGEQHSHRLSLLTIKPTNSLGKEKQSLLKCSNAFPSNHPLLPQPSKTLRKVTN